MQDNSHILILASASLGRKRLLDYLKVPYKIVPSTLDEDKIIGKDPIDTIRLRAKLKGEDVVRSPKLLKKPYVSRRYTLEARRYLILSADSDAILDGKLYSKPKTYRQAYETLKTLSGKTHEFVTATFILIAGDAKEGSRDYSSRQKRANRLYNFNKDEQLEKMKTTKTYFERFEVSRGKPERQDPQIKILLDKISRSYVTFRKLTDNDIKLYLKLTEYTRFAGAYALSSAQNFITGIKGSVSNVIGLPLELIIPVLKKEKLLR